MDEGGCTTRKGFHLMLLIRVARFREVNTVVEVSSGKHTRACRTVLVATSPILPGLPHNLATVGRISWIVFWLPTPATVAMQATH